MIPLTLAATGDRVQVIKVGGSSEQKKHLEDMGFVAGAQVEIVSTVATQIGRASCRERV